MRANLSRTCCAELSVVGVEYGWFGCWSSAVAVLYSGWLVGGCGAEVVRQRGATVRCGGGGRRRGAAPVRCGRVPGRCCGLGGGFQKFSRPSWPKMCGMEHFFGGCESPWRFLHQEQLFGALVLEHLPADRRSGAKWGRWVYERASSSRASQPDSSTFRSTEYQ